MHLNCPECQGRVDLSQYANTSESIKCQTCGVGVRLANVATDEYKPSFRQELGDKVELSSVVGEGVFGTVYRGRDLNGRAVAVKVPRRGMWADDAARARFVKAARAAAQLRHPSIVTVHAVHEAEGVPYLVQDYVEGTPLAAFMKDKRLPFREAAELVATLAEALHYAHTARVIHGNLKPSNVMLDARRSPYLLDFGLAKGNGSEITMTPEGEVISTPAYVSPEQARGEPVTARSDVYSLGVILYELLTGVTPFRGNTRMMLHQVIHDEALPPRHLNDQIPPELDLICKKCLQKEPGKRYPTAKALAEDLRRFLGGQPIQARPPGGLQRGLSWFRRHRVAIGVTAALSLVFGMALAAVIWLWRDTTEKLAETDRQKKQTEENLKLAKAEAQKADENFQEASRAVEDLFQRVRADRTLQSPLPGMEPLRRDLLGSAQQYYQRVLQRGEEPKLRLDSAKAKYHVGYIIGQFGAPDQGAGLTAEALTAFDELHSTDPQNENLRRLVADSTLDLGIMQRRAGSSDKAVETLDRVVKLQEGLPREQAGEPGERYRLALAYQSLGMAHEELKQPKKALAAYEKADEAARALPAAQTHAVKYRALSAAIHAGSGRVQQEQLGQSTAARKSYELALKELNALNKDAPEDALAQDLLGKCLFGLGKVHESLKEPEQAIVLWERALPIREKLARDNPTANLYQVEFGLNCSVLGDTLTERGQPAEALRLLTRAIEAQRKLVKDQPTSGDYRRILAQLCDFAGTAHAKLGQKRQALSLARQAVEEQTLLAKGEQATPEDQEALALFTSHVAAAEATYGRAAARLKLLQEASALCDKLAGVKHQSKALAGLQERLPGELAAAQKAVTEAEELRAKVKEDLDELDAKLSQEPALDDVRQALLAKQREYAKVLRTLGQIPQAASAYEGSIANSAKLAAEYPIVAKFRHTFMETCLALAHLHQESVKEGKASREALLVLNRGLTDVGKVGDPTGLDHYLVACLRAQQAVVAAAIDDKISERQKYLDQAMEALRQAVAGGFTDAARLRLEPYLDPLREREDFQRLVAGMKQK